MLVLPTAIRLQIFLNEAGTEVNIQLYQRRIADRLEAVNLTRLDYKNVSGAALEGFAVDRPHPTAFTDELNLVIRMAMRSRSRACLPVEQEHGDTGLSVFGSDKLMRTANEWQILLPYVMHPCYASGILNEDCFRLGSGTNRKRLRPSKCAGLFTEGCPSEAMARLPEPQTTPAANLYPALGSRESAASRLKSREQEGARKLQSFARRDPTRPMSGTARPTRSLV